jgi:acetyl-CoA acyltransferase
MIRAGEADLVLAGGVESMSRAPFVMPKADTAFSRNAEIYDTTIGWRFVNPVLKAQYGVDSMPETGENVAEDFHQPRGSGRLCAQKPDPGGVAQAIRPSRQGNRAVEIPRRKGDPMIVDTDEHPRPAPRSNSLPSCPPRSAQGGSVTAGNASASMTARQR